MTTRPLIGVPACVKEVDGLPFHAAGEKYITAVAHAANGLPWIIPALGAFYDIPDLVARLDGLFITGSHHVFENFRAINNYTVAIWVDVAP